MNATVPVGALLAGAPAAGWDEAAAEVNLTALGAGQVPGYVLANGTALLVSALLQNLTTAETRAFFGAFGGGFDLSAFSFGNFMGGRGFDWSAFDVFGIMSGFGFGGGGGGYEADAPGFDPFADDPFGNK